MLRIFSACLAALFLAFFAAGCAHPPRTAETQVGGARIERVDKEFDLGDSIRRVAIDNPLGEINVRSRDEREVGIHAVIQRLPPRFEEATLRSRRDGDTLRIEVVLPSGATAGRADLAVYVPSDVPLALSTREGRIAAKRRAAGIEARSESGEIQASSLGRLDLFSRSGQIRAIAIGKRWQGDSEIRTETGPIVLLVPTFGDVALDARTGGKLSTGFGLSVHALAQGGEEAHARYGAGTSILRAHSTSGNIALEQLVLLGDDKGLPEDDD